MADWKLWFVQLSGWSAFLATVAIVLLVSLTLPAVMTWISHRSVVQSVGLAMVALVVIAGIALMFLAWLSRL